MQLSKILVAHDFSEPATRALVYAQSLARRLGATVHVVHVHPDVYDGHSDPALGTPWPTPEQEARYLRFLEQELARLIEHVLPGSAGGAATAQGAAGHGVERHVVRGNPVKRIEALADELGADLICIGSTGKGAVQRLLLGSVSQSIVRTSRIPVLTVH
jgi:nucleotide-binding universal stress UspA family protein